MPVTKAWSTRKDSHKKRAGGARLTLPQPPYCRHPHHCHHHSHHHYSCHPQHCHHDLYPPPHEAIPLTRKAHGQSRDDVGRDASGRINGQLLSVHRMAAEGRASVGEALVIILAVDG